MITKCTNKQDFDLALKIVDQYASWLSIDLSFQNYEFEVNNFKDVYGRPKGAFFIASLDGEVVGGIGLRYLDKTLSLKYE